MTDKIDDVHIDDAALDDDFEKYFNEANNVNAYDVKQDVEIKEVASEDDDLPDIDLEEQLRLEKVSSRLSKSKEQEAEIERLRQVQVELEHKAKSDAGRVSALTKKLEEVEKQKTEQTISKADMDEINEMDADELAELLEVFPNLDKLIDNMADKRVKKVREELEAKITPLIEEREREQEKVVSQQTAQKEIEQEKARAAFESEYPDWLDKSKSKEFIEFFNTLPKAQQEYARDNLDYENHKMIFDLFELKSGKTSDKSKVKAESISAERKKKLAANVSIKNGGKSPSSEPADDFEAAFNHYVDKRKNS